MHYNYNLHLPIITIIKNFKATEFPPSWQFQRVQAPQDLQMVIHMSSLYMSNPTIIAFQHQLYITSLLVEMLQHRYWWPWHISNQHTCLLLHSQPLQWLNPLLTCQLTWQFPIVDGPSKLGQDIVVAVVGRWASHCTIPSYMDWLRAMDGALSLHTQQASQELYLHHLRRTSWTI